MAPLITPEEVVLKELYRPSKEELEQTYKWEEVSVRRSLTGTPQFRRFRSSVRSFITPCSNQSSHKGIHKQTTAC